MNPNARRSNFLAALLGALAVAIPFGALLAVGAFDTTDDPAPTTATAPAATSAAPARGATDVSSLYARVSPGVVEVETRTDSGGGTGSGFVLDEDGHILTNEHVVDRARSVRVRFSDGPPVSARVVGSDASSDLALLRVDPDAHDLTPLALGSSKGLKVGQTAVAIGSPFGLQGTVTSGVVSAIGRSITAPNNFPIDGVVQTDAAINPGNSGGPLLDAAGRVVGVNAQIASSTGANDGVGFAIPIDTAKDVLPALKAGREVVHAYLGVATGDASSGTGAVVGSVAAGGPADDAGIRPGDRIVAIGGRTVETSSDVVAAVGARKPGDEVEIRVRRGGDERTVTVTLARRPASAS